MKKYHPKVPIVGDIVQILFDDHCENMDRHVEVEAFGRVSRIDRKSLTISGWNLPDETDVGNGSTIWTILRGVINVCNVLTPSHPPVL